MAGIREKIKLWQGKWIKIEKAEYEDRNGKIRQWEFCSRIRKSGAVLIVALLRPSRRIVLVRQFRPPVGRWTIEFPAGLIDKGELLADGALRELREECGLSGKLISIKGPFFSSPGLTSESVSFAFIEIDENEPNAFCGTDFDDSEDIETFFVPSDDMEKFLHSRQELGDFIDAKVASISFIKSFLQLAVE